MIGSSIGTGQAPQAETAFRNHLTSLHAPAVLEMGTRRWKEKVPTHHQSWAPHASKYVMTDVQEGIDVDVVADGHDLAPFSDGEFNAYISISVYEHLQRPWIAAQAAKRVLATGGIALIVTHQTFPLHGYPYDFFRFSDRALSGIFEDAGFRVVDAGYQYPCQIKPPSDVIVWNDAAPAYLNVALYAIAE